MIGECPYAGCMYRRGDHDEPAVCSQASTILRGTHESVENHPGRTIHAARDGDDRRPARLYRIGVAGPTAAAVARQTQPIRRRPSARPLTRTGGVAVLYI